MGKIASVLTVLRHRTPYRNTLVPINLAQLSLGAFTYMYYLIPNACVDPMHSTLVKWYICAHVPIWTIYEPRESLHRECENFPQDFPPHPITLKGTELLAFIYAIRKLLQSSSAIIKGPSQPVREGRITLRPKTKLPMPLALPVSPILLCLSGKMVMHLF